MGHGITHKDSQGLIDAAYNFAKQFHQGQKRKYTGEDYIHHPVEVANIVHSITKDCNMMCAAMLHDVLEDTTATHKDFINWGMGFIIYPLVVELTDVSKPSDGNRKFRKNLDLEHLAKSTVDAATIKLADLISNSKSIMEHDLKFAKVYMNEKRELLKVLQHGNRYLLAEAQSIVDSYFNIAKQADK